jgi:hypothetical protein
MPQTQPAVSSRELELDPDEEVAWIHHNADLRE